MKMENWSDAPAGLGKPKIASKTPEAKGSKEEFSYRVQGPADTSISDFQPPEL